MAVGGTATLPQRAIVRLAAAAAEAPVQAVDLLFDAPGEPRSSKAIPSGAAFATFMQQRSISEQTRAAMSSPAACCLALIPGRGDSGQPERPLATLNGGRTTSVAKAAVDTKWTLDISQEFN